MQSFNTYGNGEASETSRIARNGNGFVLINPILTVYEGITGES